MLRKRPDRIKGISGSLDTHRILVVDAVAGAGAGIVRVLALAGAEVLAASSDTALLDVSVAKIVSPPRPIQPVGKPADVATSFPPRVDALVVNPSETDRIDAVWLDIAATGARLMRDRGHTGSIVFVAPIARSGTDGAVSAYLVSAMQNLAAELAPNAIRVNAVGCGPVGSTRRGQVQSSRATPLGHVTVHPVDVGKAVWYLLNPELSAAVTGTVLTVDRGASLLRPDW
jgi:NAD(P)-dependent dehydrogenase (short-subunit alcohol dehydrogenase family)